MKYTKRLGPMTSNTTINAPDALLDAIRRIAEWKNVSAGDLWRRAGLALVEVHDPDSAAEIRAQMSLAARKAAKAAKSGLIVVLILSSLSVDLARRCPRVKRHRREETFLGAQLGAA